jgi:hypothetical protein
MRSWYGHDKVEIIKVDGIIVTDIRKRYSIPSVPYLIHINPDTNGKLHSVFNYSPRNYETCKLWMTESMGIT